MAWKLDKGSSVDVKIEGLSKLVEELEAFPELLANEFMQQALREAAQPMLEQVRAGCPVRTGTLRKSIRLGIGRKTPIGITAVYIRAGGKGAWGDAFYARWVELTGARWHVIQSKRDGGALFRPGTGKHPVKAVVHPGMKARPFMRPAFDATANDVVARFGAILRNSIEQHKLNIRYGP